MSEVSFITMTRDQANTVSRIAEQVLHQQGVEKLIKTNPRLLNVLLGLLGHTVRIYVAERRDIIELDSLYKPSIAKGQNPLTKILETKP